MWWSKKETLFQTAIFWVVNREPGMATKSVAQQGVLQGDLLLFINKNQQDHSEPPISLILIVGNAASTLLQNSLC